MPSASRSPSARRGAVLVVAFIAAGVLAGCATTQRTAARLQLNDARLRASAAAVRLPPDAPGPTAVRVAATVVLRSGDGLVVVVSLRNVSHIPVSDLPISVGYRTGRRRVYLNAEPGLAYFSTHIPVVAARGRLSWVLDVRGRLPRGAQPFAQLGARSAVDGGGVHPVAITVSLAGVGRDRATAWIINRSSIPQYQLPVYVLLTAGDRVLAAGVSTVGTLGGGGRVKVDIPLEIRGAAGHFHVEAPATIFN